MEGLILSGAAIIDGTGAPRRRADVVVEGDTIAAVRDDLGASGERLDCSGLVVAPGFIDIHAHSDLTLLENPRGESKIHQGVTTEISGQCGLTPFPVPEDAKETMAGVCSFIAADVEWTWETTGEYIEALSEAAPAYNVGVLVGHSGLRATALGFDDRPATDDEIAAMERLLREAFDAGALAFSTCLSYPLGSFADGRELEALCRVVAERESFWTVHLRDEGPMLLESVAEALDLARRTESRVHIDHLKATQEPNWGKVAGALELIDEAAADGLDVTFDVYPYTAGSRHLHGSLPGWCQSGGTEAMLARLRDPGCRRRLREELDTWAQGQGTGGGFALDFPNIQITAAKTEANQWVVGQRLDEIAERRGQDPLEATLDLLIEEEAFVSAVLHAMCEEDVRTALAHPLGCIGSDGIAFAPYGGLARGMPHPRSYGTFPRFLGHYCRDEGLLSLEEGVRKCTSLPARRLGLDDRGVIRPGAKADLVVFDPETIIDCATYTDPHRYPLGVRHVIVNGQVVLSGEGETQTGAGEVLASPGQRAARPD